MVEQIDAVAIYGRSLGWTLRPKTVLVEGTTDIDLFRLADSLAYKKTGMGLLGRDLAIVPAGLGDRGGTRGVVRELISLRSIGRTCLLPNGQPRYRFIGLFDDDRAGRAAVKQARNLDSSILEYKDVFRIQPIMPTSVNLDPRTLQKTFERLNAGYNGLDWELEDLLPKEFHDAFLSDFPNAVSNKSRKGNKVHYDYTPAGKYNLHRFIKDNAVYEDLGAVIDVLKAIKFYLCV
jgi:hypothetical protein